MEARQSFTLSRPQAARSSSASSRRTQVLLIAVFSVLASPFVGARLPHSHSHEQGTNGVKHDCIHDKLEHKSLRHYVHYDYHPFYGPNAGSGGELTDEAKRWSQERERRRRLSQPQQSLSEERSDRKNPSEARTAFRKENEAYYDDDSSQSQQSGEDGSELLASHSQRKLAGSSYQPLRIYAHFLNDRFSGLDEDAALYLKTEVIPAAVATWSAALSVVPVSSPLRVEKECDYYWMAEDRYVCYREPYHQLCLDLPIPEEYFDDLRICPDTCNGRNCEQSKCETQKGGSGVAGTDFIILIAAERSDNCGPSTLAYATSCRRDQFDRPTMGMINFCPTYWSAAMTEATLSEHARQQHVDVAVHELAHALGFSAQHLAYFRDSEGQPRTPRDKYGYPDTSSSLLCLDGKTRLPGGPSNKTTVAVEEQRGQRVAKLKTPRVLATAREHFGCSSLTGAELEDQGASCIGSHWEERVLETETMSPLQSHNEVLSNLTLSFFEDSGWYKPNYTISSPLLWGREEGCAFVDEKCLQGDKNDPQSLSDRHFCTENYQRSCSVDYTSRAQCFVSDLATYGVKVPENKQYFENPDLGGPRDFADFCPIYEGFSHLDCRSENNAPFDAAAGGSNDRGEYYGMGGRCLHSSLSSTSSSTSSASLEGGCYQTSCASDGKSYKLTIPASSTSPSGQKVLLTCSQAGQEHTVEGYGGIIRCADPQTLCELRDCPARCSGRGRCLSSGKCLCHPGFGGNDCSEQLCPNNCSGRGTCDKQTKSCRCDACFEGQDCSNRKTGASAPGHCTSTGTRARNEIWLTTVVAIGVATVSLLVLQL